MTAFGVRTDFATLLIRPCLQFPVFLPLPLLRLKCIEITRTGSFCQGKIDYSPYVPIKADLII